MTRRGDRVLIAGGGIGGLAAAIALGRRGIESKILERSHFAEESGAGVQLGPNATRALRALGILDAIEIHSFRPEAIVIHDGVSGRKLASMPLGKDAEQRYGAPYLTLHRADLHAALRAMADSLAPVSLTPDFELTAIDVRDSLVMARSVGGAEARGGGLVGADGLWSTVRSLLMPRARLRFAGATAWRARLKRQGLPAPFGAPVVGLWLGPRAHLVHYPVRGGDELNVVAVAEGGADCQGWNQPAAAETLLASFTRWAKDSKSLLQQVAGWRAWSLYQLPALRHWCSGPVALIGDAAHPVLPFLAQGAALAIEDATTLAGCIAAGRGDITAAFTKYEGLRRPRATRVQHLSQRFGWLYHMRGPLRVARNIMLERQNEETALRRFDWLYGAQDNRC